MLGTLTASLLVRFLLIELLFWPSLIPLDVSDAPDELRELARTESCRNSGVAARFNGRISDAGVTARRL